MKNSINTENLSEEEAYELCLKLLDKANQDVLDMIKSINDTENYCNKLDNLGKNIHLLHIITFLSKINSLQSSQFFHHFLLSKSCFLPNKKP